MRSKKGKNPHTTPPKKKKTPLGRNQKVPQQIRRGARRARIRPERKGKAALQRKGKALRSGGQRRSQRRIHLKPQEARYHLPRETDRSQRTLEKIPPRRSRRERRERQAEEKSPPGLRRSWQSQQDLARVISPSEAAPGDLKERSSLPADIDLPSQRSLRQKIGVTTMAGGSIIPRGIGALTGSPNAGKATATTTEEWSIGSIADIIGENAGKRQGRSQSQDTSQRWGEGRVSGVTATGKGSPDMALYSAPRPERPPRLQEFAGGRPLGPRDRPAPPSRGSTRRAGKDPGHCRSHPRGGALGSELGEGGLVSRRRAGTPEKRDEVGGGGTELRPRASHRWAGRKESKQKRKIRGERSKKLRHHGREEEEVAVALNKAGHGECSPEWPSTKASGSKEMTGFRGGKGESLRAGGKRAEGDGTEMPEEKMRAQKPWVRIIQSKFRKWQRRTGKGPPLGAAPRRRCPRERQLTEPEGKFEKEGCRWRPLQPRRSEEGEAERTGLESLESFGVTGRNNPEMAAVGSDPTKNGPYERGEETPPLARDQKKLPAPSSTAALSEYEAGAQSMHVSSPCDGAATRSNDLVTVPWQLSEDLASDRRGAQKRAKQLAFEGLPLGWCGSDLFQCLLEVLPLRSQDTGRRSSFGVFPLPTSRSVLLDYAPGITEFEVFWCLSICISLNSLWGSEVLCDGTLNEGQCKCLDGILRDVKRFIGIHQVVGKVDWENFFHVKSIDYKGDEVKVAQWFQWQNIAPALPQDVGGVPLDEVCTHGCKEYVLNFERYLKPESEWGAPTRPRVMVADVDWPEVCKGLVASGVCVYIPEEDVFHTGSGPLLNGMFGVTKDETSEQGFEIHRLIMNLIPLNGLCKPLAGDVDTLPAWSAMSPFFLQPNERLLVSSEDVKCFFYTMSVPQCWVKFLAFNKLVPDTVLPPELKGSRVYLASRVLPMGFLNSVSLAQHVHRNLVKWSSTTTVDGSNGVNVPEAELRKDREFSVHNPNWSVYLDNYDLLERVKCSEVSSLEGTQAAGVLSLRHEYEKWGIPRNLKKSVQRSSLCELQGATVDGEAGVAYPRESKLAKYFGMALDLCYQPFATQRQWQVVCGGLVYFSMFRRPLLGSLNRVWQHIVSFDTKEKRRLATPPECQLELLRFLGMLPLARMDFRLDMSPMVTCSDASQQGGGICASGSLTPLGQVVAQGALRGEVPESGDLTVFSLGLFDGIGALRVALELINVKVLGHVSVECNKSAQRVVESHYPGIEAVDDIQLIDAAMVDGWAARYSQCSLVLIGAGPPFKVFRG